MGILLGVIVGMLVAIIDHRKPNPTCGGYWKCFGTYFVIVLSAIVGGMIQRVITH